MKTRILALAMVLLSAHCFAQSNNPYDQRGQDYAASLDIIKADIKAGKFTSFSGDALTYYGKSLPLQTQMTPELAASIVKQLKSKDFNLKTMIQQSAASRFVKDAMIDLYEHLQTKSRAEFDRYLYNKVEEIKGARADAADKEIVLTVFAFASRALPPDGSSGSGGPDDPVCVCNINGGCGNTGQCAAAGAIGGFVFGLGICGFWCGVGGAVIGAVVFGFC